MTSALFMIAAALFMIAAGIEQDHSEFRSTCMVVTALFMMVCSVLKLRDR